MNELLHIYIEAWPRAWLLDTGRYLVAAAAMAAILVLCRRSWLALGVGRDVARW